jgi:hypothetical protein
MGKYKITVLTDPMPWGSDFFYEGFRRVARYLRDFINFDRAYYNHPKYRGHFAVTRSVIEGFIKIKANFNYNPLHPSKLADTIVVLAGVRTLRQAIKLKKKGVIKKLFAGPNIVSFSYDHNYLAGSPEIDKYILNCDWTLDLYVEDCPSLKNRCLIWPAGVDTGYWKPDERIKSDSILIFEKQNKGPVGPILPYADYLRSLGWKVNILKYGSFSHKEYRSLLQKSVLMIGFVIDESQGIAWAEAWSTNVPTLIWRNNKNSFLGRTYKTSTAPYLCKANGLFFDNFIDFKKKFDFWEKNRKSFAPRKWVIKNMSDEVCSSKLLKMLIK